MFFISRILSQLFNPISPLSLYSLYFHISLFWIYNLWADGWIKLARQKISGIMGQFGQSLFFAHSSSGAYCWTTWDNPPGAKPINGSLLKAFLCCFHLLLGIYFLFYNPHSSIIFFILILIIPLTKVSIYEIILLLYIKSANGLNLTIVQQAILSGIMKTRIGGEGDTDHNS
jgi:hypothetical protein